MGDAHLRLLGTGTAFHTDGRGAQSILVHPGSDAPFLVDLGPTAMSTMMTHGIECGDISRLFVTHLHGDHTAGWPFFLLNLNFLSLRKELFQVYGPTGVKRTLEGLMDLCYGEIVESPGLGFALAYHELSIRESTGLDASGMVFDALPMEHHASSLGYRFDVCGTSVGVTGDTRWCDNLERLARSCDVLLIECTGVEEQAHAHVSLDEIRERGQGLGDCRVVLVHLTDEVAANLAADPLPRVVAGYDGMTIPL